jgi:hypothetical protein
MVQDVELRVENLSAVDGNEGVGGHYRSYIHEEILSAQVSFSPFR